MRTFPVLFVLVATALAALPAAGGVRQSADAPIVYGTGSGGPQTRPTDIYVRDGGVVRRLTRTSAGEAFPSWSPDRKRIVFSRAIRNDADIWVMKADGTGARRLAGSARGPQDRYPAWSPNGKLIAFASNRAGEGDIYVMRADGTGLRRLTRNARHIDDTQPRFSPDGRYIVFNSNRLAHSNYEIYRVRVSDGRGLTRLTFWGSGGDLTPGDDLMAEYSPDGSRIAFVSDRRDGYGIWTMRADGKDLRFVVSHRGLNVAFPRWSPDGSKLLYTTFPSAADNDFKLRIVPATGGTPTVVGPGSEGDW